MINITVTEKWCQCDNGRRNHSQFIDFGIGEALFIDLPTCSVADGAKGVEFQLPVGKRRRIRFNGIDRCRLGDDILDYSTEAIVRVLYFAAVDGDGANDKRVHTSLFLRFETDLVKHVRNQGKHRRFCREIGRDEQDQQKYKDAGKQQGSNSQD